MVHEAASGQEETNVSEQHPGNRIHHAADHRAYMKEARETVKKVIRANRCKKCPFKNMFIAQRFTNWPCSFQTQRLLMCRTLSTVSDLGTHSKQNRLSWKQNTNSVKI